MSEHHEQRNHGNRRQDHAQQRVDKKLPLLGLDRAHTSAHASPAVASSSAKCGSIQSRKTTSVTSANQHQQKDDRNQRQHERQHQSRYRDGRPAESHETAAESGYERKRDQHHQPAESRIPPPRSARKSASPALDRAATRPNLLGVVDQAMKEGKPQPRDQVERPQWTTTISEQHGRHNRRDPYGRNVEGRIDHRSMSRRMDRRATRSGDCSQSPR